jgi:hypothetical protein
MGEIRDIQRAKAYLERGEKRLEYAETVEIDDIIGFLSQENEGETLMYSMWERGDREKIEPHFRHLDYEIPEDLLNYLDHINGQEVEKHHILDLRGLRYAFNTLQKSLD